MRAELCETRRYLKSIGDSPKFRMIIDKAKLTPTQRKALIMLMVNKFSVHKVAVELSLSDSSAYRLLCAGYDSILRFLRSNKVDGFERFEM